MNNDSPAAAAYPCPWWRPLENEESCCCWESWIGVGMIQGTMAGKFLGEYDGIRVPVQTAHLYKHSDSISLEKMAYDSPIRRVSCLQSQAPRLMKVGAFGIPCPSNIGRQYPRPFHLARFDVLGSKSLTWLFSGVGYMYSYSYN